MGGSHTVSELQPDCPRIGLLNLMPAPALPKTEHQWRDGFLGLADIVPVRFDDDPRAVGCRSAQFLEEHRALSDVQDELDGLIVTGANLETRPDGSPLPFDEIEYIPQLREAISWAEASTRLSVYSCLASHIALDHLFDVQRDVLEQKLSGVFCHDRIESTWLTDGIEVPLRSPHSRWGSVSPKLLKDAGVAVVAEGFEVGWLLAQVSDGTHQTVFIQGHPEYWRDDLATEYRRDAQSGQPIPQNYFPGNNPSATPRYDWHDSTRQLFSNLAGAVSLQGHLV